MLVSRRYRRLGVAPATSRRRCQAPASRGPSSPNATVVEGRSKSSIAEQLPPGVYFVRQACLAPKRLHRKLFEGSKRFGILLKDSSEILIESRLARTAQTVTPD